MAQTQAQWTIMQRGQSHFLVPTTDKDAVVCNTAEGVRYPSVKTQAALARGYWEKAQDQSLAFRRRLLALPQAEAKGGGDATPEGR